MLVVLIFFMLICAPTLIQSQTAREIANNPNNFHMFENFELTRTLYVNETKIMRKLKELRENLVERKKNLQRLLESTKETSSSSDNFDHPGIFCYILPTFS